MNRIKKQLRDVPSIATKVYLFLTSYIPLYILLIIANIDTKNGIINGLYLLWDTHFFWKLIFLLTLSPLLMVYYLFKKPHIVEKPTEYQSVEDNLISYIMTYITPLLTIQVSNTQDDRTVLINIILFFIIGLLYVKQDLVYLNPTFLLLGYNIFKEIESKRYVITRLSMENIREIRLEDNELYLTVITRNLVILKRVNQ